MRERLILILLLVCQAAALAYEAWATGITADDPSHLISAHFYWQGRDVLKPRDMPPAIKIVGGWVPGRFTLPAPEDDAAAWALQHEWMIANAWLARMTPDQIQHLISYSRLPLILFPLATTALLWWWGRQLFSPWIALTAAALFAFEPTSLGHAALFKNDHASAFGLLAFAYRAWRLWIEPTRTSVLWLAVALWAAILTKLSLLVLVPVAILLVGYRLRSLAQPAILIAVVYGLTLAACQFELDHKWWMPKLYVDGVTAIADSNSTPNAIWFWGEHRPGGDRRYFLGAALVKAPLALLACLLMAIPRVRQPFVAVPGVMYLALASATSLHFGFRLVMPCLPFAVLACGYAPAWARALALAGTLGVSAASFPLGLSYFNAIGGSPEKAWFYLADSNLDWGQDLPRLAEFTRTHEVQWISTYYFGNDHPRRFLREGKYNVLAPPWDAKYAEGDVLDPKPGLYAVSANMLTGHFFAPRYRDYFRRFREMKPYGVAGGGIFVYLVDHPPDGRARK